MREETIFNKDNRQGRRSSLILALAAGLAAAAAAPFSAAQAQDEPAFTWGFAERIRQEYLGNVYDLDAEAGDVTNYLRLRSQLQASWIPARGWKVGVVLNNEHRHWFKSTKGLEDEDFEIDEFIVENLYVSAEGIGGSPLGFVAGRQNIIYGEGFLFMDGGPLDGSRTGYFNAIRAKASFGKRSIEMHLLKNPEWDHYLPVVNCLYKPLIEYEETGAGLYYTDDSFEGRRIEAYYLFKNEKGERDPLPESDIHTIGARISGKFGERFVYAAELAVQAGDRGGEGRKAAGGYAHGTWSFPVPLKPAVKGGLIYLSGDDPATSDYEGWNPLYSRWPKWSDLYIYTLGAHENGAAYWDNLMAPNLGVSIKPAGAITLEATVYFMTAPEDDPDSAPGVATPDPIFGEGGYRGTLSNIKLTWSAKKYLFGHLQWERFVPGDYYFGGADAADFLRCEFNFRYGG